LPPYRAGHGASDRDFVLARRASHAVTDTAAPAAGPRLAAPFGRLVGAWLRLCVLLLVAEVYAIRVKAGGPETAFFWRQDLPVLILMVAATVGLGFAPQAWLARLRLPQGGIARLWVLALAGLCAAAGVLGVSLVFGGYTLSLDEFMANFDARIFASGRFVAPVAPAWRPFATVLQPIFMLQTPGDSVWASAYLPVNAAMRAVAGLIGAADWVNPLLSAFSVVAVWGVGRRLWPDQPRIALMAAVLLGTSAQLIVTAMTAYAMPAHLAFNLAWLWLFLRGGRLGHAGAIAVGFLATGIHQVLFHPLFAAPFILQLWLDRRWALAGLYTAAYAAIGGFWIEYWHLVMTLAGVPEAHAGALGGGGWVLDRVGQMFAAVHFDNLGKMGLSLVRLITWQNLLTLPLAFAGALAAERAKGHLRSLVFGVGLTLAAMLILEPSQVHGWGYRYAHGVLGSLCLIAAWTWSRLTAELPAARRPAAGGAFLLACAISLVVLLPVRLWQAQTYVRPYRLASEQVHAAPSQVVIVDPAGDPGFDPGTVVRNDPFLATSPKVMQLPVMDAAMVRQICATQTVRVFTGQDAAADGVDTFDAPSDPHVLALRALMKQLNCGVPIT
jgi:hypothetical protein